MAYSQHHDPHATPTPVHSAPAAQLSSQDWLYPGHGYQQQPTYGQNQPLQEPVPFEDFQFSFGLDPNFAIPVPLDMPPAPVAEESSGMMFEDSLFQNFAGAPPASSSAMSGGGGGGGGGNTSLLNEDDQRIFANFLDNFCMEQDVEPLPSHMPSLYDLPPSSTSPTYQQQEQQQHSENPEEEERRRNSILRSLDEQKRMRHRILADGVPHQSNTPVPSSSSSSSYHHHHHLQHASSMDPHTTWPSPPSTGGGAIFLKKSDSIATPYVIPSKRSDKKKAASAAEHHDPAGVSTRPTPARRNKPHKELLTEAEKRANHIASEQKRRTTIRTGFKDLTEIVPTLKNINNSKSTVLFKAVDYIKYLEKRTKSLHDQVHTLELRMQVEGRSVVVHPDGGTTGRYGDRDAAAAAAAVAAASVHAGGNGGSGGRSAASAVATATSAGVAENSSSNSSTEQALRQHSMQQKHLMQLQEELQKKLLAQHHHHHGFSRPVPDEMDVDEEPLKATVSA